MTQRLCYLLSLGKKGKSPSRAGPGPLPWGTRGCCQEGPCGLEMAEEKQQRTQEGSSWETRVRTALPHLGTVKELTVPHLHYQNRWDRIPGPRPLLLPRPFPQLTSLPFLQQEPQSWASFGCPGARPALPLALSTHCPPQVQPLTSFPRHWIAT